MIKKSIHITFLCLIGLSLFGSIIHYHEESLSCLEHANEEHYVQSGDYCPLTLVRGNALISKVEIPTNIHVALVCFDSLTASTCLATPPNIHLGRAPPV